MKVVFLFSKETDALKVTNCLARQFTVKCGKLCSHFAVYVMEADYQAAITAGIEFIRHAHIQNVRWFREDGRQMRVTEVPLLFAEIPAFFKKNNFFKRTIAALCRQYAKGFSKKLDAPVTCHFKQNFNVEYRLARFSAPENHDHYVDSINKHIMRRWYIFNYITIYDAFGNPIISINRNHTVD